MYPTAKARIDKEVEETAYYMNALYERLMEEHGFNSEAAGMFVASYFKGGVN